MLQHEKYYVRILIEKSKERKKILLLRKYVISIHFPEKTIQI